MTSFVTRLTALSSPLLMRQSSGCIGRLLLPAYFTRLRPQTMSLSSATATDPQTKSTADEGELLGPTPTGQKDTKVYPDHIEGMVDTISKLTLLEVADLNELLKKKLGIEGGAMMPMMGAMPGFQQTATDDDSDEAPVAVKTHFNVRLTKFDPTKKVPLIKEIKAIIPDMNLVQAKKFVEAAPDIVKKEVTKEEAEEIKKALEAAGGTIEIE